MKSSIHQQKSHWWLSSKGFLFLFDWPATLPDKIAIEVKSAAETSMARGAGKGWRCVHGS